MIIFKFIIFTWGHHCIRSTIIFRLICYNKSITIYFCNIFKRSAPFCKSGNVEKCVSFQTDTDPTSCWVFAPLYPWHLAASLAAHLVHSDASFEFCTRLHETRRKSIQWKEINCAQAGANHYAHEMA